MLSFSYIPRLQMMYCLQVHELSESLLFGEPDILIPHADSFDSVHEMQTNENSFSGLCQVTLAADMQHSLLTMPLHLPHLALNAKVAIPYSLVYFHSNSTMHSLLRVVLGIGFSSDSVDCIFVSERCFRTLGTRTVAKSFGLLCGQPGWKFRVRCDTCLTSPAFQQQFLFGATDHQSPFSELACLLSTPPPTPSTSSVQC